MKRTRIGKNPGEAGSAALVLMMFLGLGALTIITVSTLRGIGESRSLDQSRTKLHEKWQARSGANILSAIVRKDAPRQLEADVRTARDRCGVDVSLPIFDNQDISSKNSSPAVTFREQEIECSRQVSIGRDSFTSVFGTVENWRGGRVSLFEGTGQNSFGLDSENTKVVEFTEIYRRSLGADFNDLSYAVRFIVESKSGNYRTRANGEIILGAALPNCGTRLSLEIVPTTVTRGNSIEVRIRYAYANRLDILNSSGTSIHSANVSEQSSDQMYYYSFSPATSETYSAIASGSGGCQASTPGIPVTVTEPVVICPQILDFSASSLVVNEGESVTLSWNVTGATVLTLDGVTARARGSQSFVITADRTFTLAAAGESGTCPVSRQITVRVRPVPPGCSFSTPVIQSFSGSPVSVAIGENVTFSWSVSGLVSSQVVLTGPSGFSFSGNAAGSTTTTPPLVAGDYIYTLRAENTCPDGTRLTAQQNVVIQVRACPPPSIDNFIVSPGSVSTGGTSYVTFAWNISGSADAVSISNGVGSGLPASGTIDVLQPQSTTTYTITAVGCGQTRQAQVTVTVQPAPGFCPVIPAPGNPDAIAGAGHGGRQNLAGSGSGDAEYRAIYKVSHYPNNTYRFNIQMYYSGMDPMGQLPIIGPQVNGPYYIFELGKLMVHVEFEGVRFFSDAGVELAFYRWQGRQFAQSGYNSQVGYLTLGLIGNGTDDPGVVINYAPFDFSNDLIRTNSYTTVAHTVPFSVASYPATPLNIAISANPPSRWACP